ncbi:LamG domain-containing protein, partial [Gramella jeungdoensis]
MVDDAADNCGTATVTFVSQTADPAVNDGTITRTYQVDDGNGQTITVTQDIVINDTQAPTASNPAAINVQCLGDVPAVDIAVVDDAADNCGTAIVTFVSQTADPAVNDGTIIRTYQVDDGNGNSINVTQNIVIDDLTTPIPNTSNITDSCSVTIDATFVSAIDNCAGTIYGTTADFALPHTFDTIGIHSVSWEFNDGNGNIEYLTQTIIIEDNQVPNPGTLINISETGCEYTPTAPVANDGCQPDVIGVPDVLLPITRPGLTIVTWTFTDSAGNQAIATQNVNLTPEVIDGGNLTGTLDGFAPSDDISLTSCSTDSYNITMDLSGEDGTIIQWEKFVAGSADWVVIPNTTDSHSVTFNSTNNKSTLFKVLVRKGTCELYSNAVNVHSLPPDVPPTLDIDSFNVCFNDEITLIARSGYTQEEDIIEGSGGNFNNGQFQDKFNDDMWRIDGEAAATYWTANANSGKPTNWAGTNPQTFGSIVYDSGNPKFGISQGDYASDWVKKKKPQVFATGYSSLETPIFSLENVSSAFLEFDQAYNLVGSDYAILELSLDGGVTYSIVLQSLSGGDTWDWQNHPGSSATAYNFENDDSSFDLSAYVGETELRVRWKFHGTSDESVWAVDGITLPVIPTVSEIEWTEGIGDPNIDPLANGELELEFKFTPDAPGQHEYGATTLVNGCRAYDIDGTAIAKVTVNYAYAGEDQLFSDGNCGAGQVKLNAYDNTKSANENATKGSFSKPTDCLTCDDDGTMAIGVWEVIPVSGTCGGGYVSDVNDPDAIFKAEAGIYDLRWTVEGCSDVVRIEIQNCKTVDFDGNDDYIDFGDANYDLDSEFSIEMWIKPHKNATNSVQTLFSKKDSNSSANNGYELKLENDYISFHWNGSGSIKSDYPLRVNNNDEYRWYHVAVTYDGLKYNLYIDGIDVKNGSGSKVKTNNYNCLVGARFDNDGAQNHFSGWIDEFRIWNVSLKPDQIHQMMNQEIEANGSDVNGSTIGLPISGLAWSDLEGYYQMTNLDCGYLEANNGSIIKGRLLNIDSSIDKTAPLPYTSANNGDWNNNYTWSQSIVWDPPNSLGINGDRIDWNIVEISNDINSLEAGGANGITLLGLISNSGELTIAANSAMNQTNSGRMLWITHYLRLNGSIDLVGESQLLQKKYGYYSDPPFNHNYITTQLSESILATESTGYIEIDQQGQGNLYNYDFRSSPVSIPGAGSISTYTIKGVMFDGINVTASDEPKEITFNTSRDGDALTNPIELSTRWLYLNPNAASWTRICPTCDIKIGEGFTFKGSIDPLVSSDSQNFVFKGKPNNGTFNNLTIGTNWDSYLVGNPYPSAMDADQFIIDNGQIIQGAVYYYHDFGTDNSHLTGDASYGYAIYSRAGSAEAINRRPENGPNGGKLPARYIPVAQGFWVYGLNGGTLKFNNNQRTSEFVTKTSSGSVLFKAAKSKKSAQEG